MSRAALTLWGVLLIPIVLLWASCGGSSSAGSAPTVQPSPEVQASPTQSPSPEVRQAQAPLEPSGERILGYVKKFADEIGARPAGTAAEKASVDFIAGLLRSFGYDVAIQDFPISNEAGRESQVSLTSPASRLIASLPLGRSGSGAVSARLVAAGIGRPAEFPAAVAGNIALIERGELTFQDKVSNAAAAGAKGVIIFNNEPGTFLGSLSQNALVPAASISQEDGQALIRELGGGPIEARVSVAAVGTAVGHNVVAKPPGKECETVTGGHFDSVLQAPGASDNATGTATTLEIAAVMARSGQMGANCFVLWGAEEIGLVGSHAYVNSLSADQRSRLKAVLNLDMVGVGSDIWLLIGTASLQTQAQALMIQLGIDARRGTLGNTSSDHASFISAGIPALMLHRTEDPLLHTPQDVSQRVRPELLEEAARFGVAFLQSFAPGGG